MLYCESDQTYTLQKMQVPVYHRMARKENLELTEEQKGHGMLKGLSSNCSIVKITSKEAMWVDLIYYVTGLQDIVFRRRIVIMI